MIIDQMLYEKREMNEMKLDSQTNSKFICPTEMNESCFISAHHFLINRVSFLTYDEMIRYISIHSHKKYNDERNDFEKEKGLNVDLR